MIKAVKGIQRLVKIVNKESENNPIQVAVEGTKFKVIVEGEVLEIASAKRAKTLLTVLSMSLKLKKRTELALDIGLEIKVLPIQKGERLYFKLYTSIGEDVLVATSNGKAYLTYKDAIGLTKNIKETVARCAMEEAKEATMQ